MSRVQSVTGIQLYLLSRNLLFRAEAAGLNFIKLMSRKNRLAFLRSPQNYWGTSCNNVKMLAGSQFMLSKNDVVLSTFICLQAF